MDAGRRLLTALLAVLPLPGQAAADALLARLSLEDKAGQLLMVWSLSRAEGQAAARAELMRQVADLGLGGVVLSLGAAEEAAALIGQLQARAKVPLLIAGDFENGLAFRLTGATDAGKAMLLGAAGDEALVEEAARVTAREARALGFHWSFSPVVDVNVNPGNPIINVRSFGESPALVSRLGAAYVRGMQAEGLLACAKHFPGHGDVASDSHLVMPTVPGDSARLDAVELAPFRAAIAAGVGSVMIGHLAVPGLGEAPDVPATLSPRIVTGVLRGELGFGDGIVVTDALDMGGVKNKGEPGEVVVRALLAGADMLLMPPDPAAARTALVAAVRDGRVPVEHLDAAVRRLLAAKERAGLLRGEGLPDPQRAKVLARPDHAALAARAAAAGLTLVRDAAGQVPLAGTARAPALLLQLLDGDDRRGDELARALPAQRRLRVLPAADDGELAAAAAAVRTAAERPVVVALHVKVRSHSGRVGLPPRFAPVVEAVRELGARAVVVSFGNPYLLAEMPEVGTYLCAYDSTPWTEGAVAAALLGSAALVARLPVSVPGHAELGAGWSRYPAPTARTPLPTAEPAALGFHDDLGDRVRAVLEQGVRERAFPGAVAQVSRRGKVVLRVAVGRERWSDDAPAMRPDTRFDLASLTKVCATGPLVLRLVAQGKLGLDDPVQRWLPQFAQGDKRAVTVRHLMTHSAGLPPWVAFWKTLRGKAAIVEAAANTPLQAAPGATTRYSDLSMILLMACAEAASGRAFADLVRDEVLQPLGMAGATFAPTDADPVAAAPTEDSPLRGGVVHGLVHDENAFAMGGVSGHAGLFATADDVTRIGLTFLGGGVGYLPPALVAEATHRQGLGADDSSRALCWDTFVPGGSGGSELSPLAFGHTGFTGTSIWCDPATDLCVVLLSNRVHPTRAADGIRAVRSALHDAVAGCLDR